MIQALTEDAVVGIVGSREFKALHLVTALVREVVDHCSEIVTGDASGVDAAVELAAGGRRRSVLTVLRADWDKHGKRAGMMRNHKLVQSIDVLIAFWDGSSPGTKDVIARARALRVPYVTIVR